MRVFGIGFGIFAVFLLVARQYVVCELWHNCPDTAALRPDTNAALQLNRLPKQGRLDLYYGDSLLLGGFEEFGFAPTTQELILTPNNQAFAARTLDFLQQNRTTQLLIIGTYSPDEPSKDGYETAGLLRAATVRDYLVHAGIAAKRIGLDDEASNLAPTVRFKVVPQSQPLLPYKTDNMAFYDDNFLERSATFRPKIAFTTFAHTLQTRFAQKNNKKLTITVFMDGENSLKAEKMATDRVQAVYDYFVALGLQENKIKMNIKINDAPIVNNASAEALQKNRRFEVAVTD